ncbi:MAG: histidinol-phosphate transaminase [Candidatus Competibacteraceae bacterium]
MSTLTPVDLIRPEIRALSPYHVPDATGMIKLDAMENPYGWPDELIDDWLTVLRTAPLNRYPDPKAGRLQARLREAFAIPADAALILGNGSDELIQLSILALAGSGRAVVAPEPSFAMYRLIAGFVGMPFIAIPLRADDFGLDLEAMLAAIERHQPALIFLAYPNNPTGNRFDARAVRRVLQAAQGLVVLDEAYFPFADHSFLSSLSEFENLLVMRTLSKMGLAGLRLGLLVGAPCWLDEFEKLRLPYNINILTQVSADFALLHQTVLLEQASRIRAERAALFVALNALPGIRAFPSETNFILVRTPAGQANRLFESLREGGILVKNLSAGGDLLRDCLRVTVGTAEENQAFLAAFTAAL